MVTSIDQAPPKATVTLDGGSETVDFYFAYEGDEAVQTVSIDDVVTLSRSDSWSIMRGDDYTIGTREVLADDFEHACVKSPAGFPEARLLASCQQKIDSDLSCSQPKKPVRLFGLELTEGSDSARAPMLETVHVGRWLGFLELGVQLRPGASPFCERDGAYASVVLVGPAT